MLATCLVWHAYCGVLGWARMREGGKEKRGHELHSFVICNPHQLSLILSVFFSLSWFTIFLCGWFIMLSHFLLMYYIVIIWCKYSVFVCCNARFSCFSSQYVQNLPVWVLCPNSSATLFWQALGEAWVGLGEQGIPLGMLGLLLMLVWQIFPLYSPLPADCTYHFALPLAVQGTLHPYRPHWSVGSYTWGTSMLYAGGTGMNCVLEKHAM